MKTPSLLYTFLPFQKKFGYFAKCLMKKQLFCSVFGNCILNAFIELCSKLVIIILEFKCVLIAENKLSYELCFLSDIKAKTNGITKLWFITYIYIYVYSGGCDLKIPSANQCLDLTSESKFLFVENSKIRFPTGSMSFIKNWWQSIFLCDLFTIFIKL